MITNIVMAGLGGQGVIKASDMLATAAFEAGYDVKKAEVHGMSQRGGSVTSDIRYGDRVFSPMVPRGEADYLLALDETQVEPARHCLRADGRILHAGAVDPATLPTPKALNVAMLGLLSVFLDIPPDAWKRAIHHYLPERLRAMNDTAFDLGRSIGEKEKAHA